MSDEAQRSDMFDVFMKSLSGADRVVVEAENALGEMDAHYLYAPELRAAIAAREADRKQVREQALREAAAKAVSLDEFELDTEGNAIGVKSANPQEISDAILALTEKDKTNG